jgi:alkylation response protein AidB-like acyl-CoA dehydrogenase
MTGHCSAKIISRGFGAIHTAPMTNSIATFRLEARRWLEANVPPEPSPEDGPQSRDYVLAWQKAQAHAGWAGIAWPREVGGRGLSVLEQIVWFEEYARAGAPSPLNASFVGLNHAGPTLIACGTAEQKAHHLPKILAGEVIWCQGFSEPGAGSDLASLKTRGRIESDELVIDGHKTWSSFADIADWQELLIRTDPAARTAEALTWVICPMNARGITVRPIRTMAGPRKYCEVFYDSVRVPLSNVVGGIGKGWATAMSTLSFERGTASLALLIGRIHKVDRLLAACPAGRPEMRMRLAQLRARGASIRAMTYRFALDSENAVPDAGGSIVRLSFAEFSQQVTAAAIDLYGIDAPEVVGLQGWGHDYLDAFSETIAGGTAEIQRNIIAERVLGLPKGPR